MTSNSTQATIEKNTRPQWTNWLDWGGTKLRQIGVPLADLSETSLLSTAQNQSQLSDWGNEDFRVALQILLKSLEREANLNFMGRLILRKYFLQLLVNRLKIQDTFKHHPEILQVPIRKPLFITGLPRTGTTFLHRLLAQDPNCRWLHLWELYNPCPPPEKYNAETDARIEIARKFIQRQQNLAPALAIAHALDAQAPEEGNQLFEHSFASMLFEFRFCVPSYGAWLKTQDMVAQYQYFRQQLQLLGWHWSGRWVLKEPVHLFHLDALLEVFPDACIVQTHRAPFEVMPSMCSLVAIVRNVFTNETDLEELGEYWLNRLVNGIERAMEVRQQMNSKCFYDVSYRSLIHDPVGTARQIYNFFDYDWNIQVETNMKQWLSRNPQHKHGVHRYSSEQFGLDAGLVNQRFTNYYEQFQSPLGI
ncbi:sulfotransferase [Pleurocapsa sp. PCC 7319]|uniref:sulfotransferase family protein n=1 Tax=Pleurocapsa sp. PCC 7319 TaxID=118161 RepID=UPI00034D3DFD|nr:sulfotransferase [Pleurocapsa sp. PCC 7319]